MNTRHDNTPPLVRLADYQSPAWSVEQVELSFDLDVEISEVEARLVLRRDSSDPDAPLRLDGEALELLSIQLDGTPLPADRYRVTEHYLEIDGARDGSVLETRVRVRPSSNTAFEGLFLSGSPEQGFLLTQCEAQGFRHITYFPDRPDVQSRYRVTLRADRARFPVLLAGGNPDGAGELPDGRHWARFVDPHFKPSYLFALVAGRLEKIERDYVTAEGRAVKLVIWSEANVIDRCHYAMDALERAMRWDEQVYGRNYDLDVFHVVATHDFNMGAMENKGLNIFNAKYLLADPDSTTDDEYRHVEAVVAHEYFHNWSGNRVTCRDWFQLSLKEGFTVFREHGFSADMNSAPIKRIEDVSLLRRAQFAEDAGPLAHPVRPAEYREINNFYTATVYEKGAELVRMLAGKLGAEGFRRGTDRYFDRNDGRAATIEDFLDALGSANGVDLRPYLSWYGQAGTPRLRASGDYDEAKRQYTLHLSQHTPPTPGQADKQALPIPVKLALFGASGHRLPLHGKPIAKAGALEQVVVLEGEQHDFVFEHVPEPPVPSLLRGFSAPVVLECDYSAVDLALLLRHDPDGFNRWEASQQLAARAWEALRDGTSSDVAAIWSATLADLFVSPGTDQALLAELLTPPSEIELAERQAPVDPGQIHALRKQLEVLLAERIGIAELSQRYAELAAQTNAKLDAASQAQRRLKRRVLQLLGRIDAASAHAYAQSLYQQAPTMTDRLAALQVLVHTQAPQAAAALSDYRQRYAGNALALDKWFAVQASVPGEPALGLVQQLLRDEAFTLKNPNRVYALLGTYSRSNPSGFHRPDGAGYRLLVDQLVALDALNPQVAARTATAFNGWERLEPVRRSQAEAALVRLSAYGAASPNLGEIVQRLRGA